MDQRQKCPDNQITAEADGINPVGFLLKTFKKIKKLTLINPESIATIIKQTQIEFEGV